MIYKYERVSTKKQSIGRQEMILYCENISRLRRNVDDIRSTCDYFKNKGVTVYFVKDGINTYGDGYKFIQTIISSCRDGNGKYY